MKGISVLCASTAVLAISTLASTSAYAQATGEAPEEVVSDQDIIVTARKRDERLQDVPTAITAVGAKEMANYSTNTLSQISSRVPQLVIANVGGPGGASINLRGVGSPGTSPSVDQAVSVNIDGIQVSQGNAVNLGIYDLDRVEVLKGPQALFYGKNSLGGIVSLVSADPGSRVEWLARAGYEFAEQRKQIEAMVSAPLSDTLGIRLVGAFGDQNGWFQNRLNNVAGSTGISTNTAMKQNNFFVRGTLKYESPGGAFDARLKIAYASNDRDNGVPAAAQLIYCPLGAPQLQVFSGNMSGVNDCSLNRIVVDPNVSAATAAASPYYLRDGKPYFEQRQFLSSLQLDLRPTDTLTLTSVSGFYDMREHWSYNASAGEIESLSTGAHVGDRQFTQELRLASSFQSPFNFVIGGFYQDADKKFEAPLIFNGFLTGGTGPLVFTDDRFRQKTTAYSFFGQGIFTLTEQFEVTAGARYSFERKKIAALKYPSALSGFSPTPVAVLFDPSSKSFDDFSPEITARYRPTRDVTLYAAYREGFTSGGFNTAPAVAGPPVVNDVSYLQARVKGVEVGLKGTAFDRQVSFDFSVYSYKYTDLQLNAFDPVTISVQVRNAASSKSRGAEGTISFSPHAVPGLTLRSSIAYNHARYQSYPDAPCYAGQSVGQGCNRLPVARFDSQTGAPLGTSFSAQDLSGAHVERAPDWTMTHGFTYDTPLSGNIGLSLGGDANYTGSFIPDPAHIPAAFQRSAWRLNGYITVKGPDNGWELSLIGRNLTNTLRAAAVNEWPTTGAPYPGYDTPGLGADLAGTYTAPRTVMLQLTLRDSLIR